MKTVLETLLEVRENSYYTYARGNKGTKALIFACSGLYEVYNNGIQILSTDKPLDAIEAYNNLGGDILE